MAFKFGLPRCGVTGKLRFETQDQARSALGAYAGKRGSRRAYRKPCEFCGGYHLTKGVRGRPGK